MNYVIKPPNSSCVCVPESGPEPCRVGLVVTGTPQSARHLTTSRTQSRYLFYVHVCACVSICVYSDVYKQHFFK